ncbi:MAG TPA: NADP-dependent malic enzyme [Myxococcales bacterium]|nr:NADP-dependent malic enzyme [Myxococcales bacterium]
MATSFGPIKIRRQDALDYHSEGRHGKIEVVPTKPCVTVRDLSLAYSPGVAEPCLEIARDPDLSYRYTARGNLVAVISNGTAVLGLGDIGPHAGKPVMEGKGVLFKRFADIDVFDLELAAKDVDSFCHAVKTLEPTFGGINLEDVKAPECFAIEERLREEMEIPVFHDDQHGTAIISGAALLNATELCGKPLASIRVVVSGAGASAMACAAFYLRLGVRPEHLLLVDTKGVIHRGRTEGMNRYKERFAVDTPLRTLAEALRGADVFLGCSVKGLVTAEMVRSMAKDPIVFALANPDPEIAYPDAVAARPDVIMATGRSDYPNQVNNVLGFPFIFRGALDVRARRITEGMKLAAAHALAALAKEEVPESVSRAYGGERFSFGRQYIIPKPFDPRVLFWVAPAVARAAMEEGVARVPVDLAGYAEQLQKRTSRSYEVMRVAAGKARRSRKRIVFPEGAGLRILQAARELLDDGICTPVLLGDPAAIRRTIAEDKLEGLGAAEILDVRGDARFEAYVAAYYALRQRHGCSLQDARVQVAQPNVFASMMVREGHADGMVTGLTQSYPEAIHAPLQVIRARPGERAGGIYLCIFKHGFKLLADCTVNVDPSAEALAEIAARTADVARYFDLTPRVALLSHSNFGSSAAPGAGKMREAVRILKAQRPDLVVDGEMQVDAAVVPEVREAEFPFSSIGGDANVLIFPNLDAANIGYKLLWRLGGAEVIGPILTGMQKPVNVLQTGASVRDIVNLATVTALRAQGDEFAF